MTSDATSTGAHSCRLRMRAPFVVWGSISLPLIALATAFAGVVSELLPAPAGGGFGIPLGIGLALLILFRARRMSIAVDESGLTFRNFWKRSRFRWQQIEKVEVRTPLGFGGRAVGLRLKGEEGFASKAPASTATLFGGQYEERSHLLETLRRFGGPAGIPIEFGLLRLGVWERIDAQQSTAPAATGSTATPNSTPAVPAGKPEGSMLEHPSRLKRFLGALLTFGPLGAAAIIVGDIDAVGIAVALIGAAVVLAAILVWDRRHGGR